MRESIAAEPAPKPPSEPAAAECCGDGCARCVFDVYDEAMERYRAALAAWQARQQMVIREIEKRAPPPAA